jgi:signal peptidase II
MNVPAHCREKEGKAKIVTFRRARIYDILALLTVIVVVILDQWTKVLVVQHLSPPDIGPRIPLIGDYLVLFYIRNNGAAFSMFDNNPIPLIVLISAAIAIIVYLYVRMLNSGSLAYKLIFGMIIGGAVSNLIDRAHHSGYVVDFVSFSIPQIGFYFAIFNLADAAISVGVFLLFVTVLFGGLRRSEETKDADSQKIDEGDAIATRNSNVSHPKKQDAQS